MLTCFTLLRIESTNTTLSNQLSNLNSSQSSSSTELDTLKRALESAEADKRSLMAVVDRIKESDVQRDDEVKTMRDRLKDAREEIAQLHTKLSQATASDQANMVSLASSWHSNRFFTNFTSY